MYKDYFRVILSFLILCITNIQTVATPSEKEELPIRAIPLNTVDDPQESHPIDGQVFRRQNVSGRGMRCFFNAIGLVAEDQIKELRRSQKDLFIREMIANEIISAAHDLRELPEQIRRIINYEFYREKFQNISKLREARNNKLAEQNSNPELTNPSLLPSELQNIDDEESKIIKDLRVKALTLEAFKAFLDHHIGNEQMMVALHDVKGDEGGNDNANLTSIDAIAYINKIALKIYQPNQKGKLHLVHRYLPNETTQIAYIYHQGTHFQALIPEKNILTKGSASSVNDYAEDSPEFIPHRTKDGTDKFIKNEQDKIDDKAPESDKISRKSKHILYDASNKQFEETVPNTETLKLKFNIPQQFTPEIESSSKLSFHLRNHLNIFENMVNALENYISVLSNNNPAPNLLLFARNCFIEHAARYILYDESTLSYDDDTLGYSFSDALEAIEIIHEISPSLDLKTCKRPLFEWMEDEELCVGFPPLMFPSIFEILKIMRKNSNSIMQNGINDLQQHLIALKIFRSYFDISEHLRVTLPILEKIRKLKTPNTKTEEEELIKTLNNLLCINEIIPYKYQTLFVSKKKKHFSNRNHSAHELVPWMMLRNLGLVSAHAASPLLSDVLYLPQNKQILHEALPTIVEESEYFIDRIEKFIILEIKEALGEVALIEVTDDTSSPPSISLLSNYGADTAYLYKIVKTFENFDFNCVPSIHVILRLMDILGEISKNLSPTIVSLNSDFWDNLKRLRDSGQHGLSFQRRLVKALEEEKSIVPLVLKDFSEIFDFAKNTLNAFPKEWSSLQNFYKTPQTNIKRIRGKGVDKLMSMLYPFYLTIDDKEELVNTAAFYIDPKDSLLLVREVITRKRPIDENTKQEEFTANVDKLPISNTTKKKLNEAYKAIKKRGFLGDKEEEHEKKSEDLLKTLNGINILTREEVRHSLKKLTEKDDRGGTVFNDATTFKHIEDKLQEIGIIDPKIINTWQVKWEKIRKTKSKEQNKKEKDKSTDDVRTIIQNSINASAEILKFIKMLHDVLGGASDNREIFFKNQAIALSVEYHLTMIRHYLGCMQEANNYVNRHDMNNPSLFKFIKFFWEVEGKIKEFSLIGNSFAHLHDVTHQDNIECGSHGRNWINWRNITLFLDGISCNCYKCANFPKHPYKRDIITELKLYKIMLEVMLEDPFKELFK